MLNLTDIHCPECGTNNKVDHSQLIECKGCGYKAEIRENVIIWFNNQTEFAPKKSFLQRLYNNGKPVTKILEIISFFIHPIFGKFSPIGWFQRRNTENYYERILNSKNMAEEWLSHYCKGISLSKDTSVLDLGCGRGRHIALLNNEGFKLHGQDIYEDTWWRQINKDTTFNVVPTDKEYLPWQENQFDLVITVMMNGFFNDIRFVKQTSEIKRVLKPGGHWLILESNPGASVLKNFTKYYGRKPRTKEETLSIIMKNNWKIENEWYERYYAPYFPMTFDSLRTAFAGNKFDICDYKTSLLENVPDDKKGLWGALLTNQK